MIRRWARVAAAVIVGAQLLSLVGVHAAAAQSSPTIELVEQTPFVRRGGTFSLTVRVSGGAPGDVVFVAVGRAMPGSGARIRQTRADLRLVDKPAEMLARDVVARFPESGPRSATGLATVTIPLTGPPNGAALEAGVWPLAIGFGPPAEPNKPKTAIMSEMIVLPEPATLVKTPPIAVTIAVPLTAKPALRPDQQVRLDQLDRSRLRTLVDRIESLPSAVLAVSPQLLRALELSANPEDTALLDRLRVLATTHEVLLEPYSNLDEEAWREAGLVPELKAQYEAGQATIKRILNVDPTPGTTIVDPSTTADTLAMLGDMGTKVFIFDEQRLDALPTGYSTPPTKLFNLKNSRGVGLSVDPELRRLFACDSVLNAHRLIADLSALYFDVANAKGAAAEERHGVVVLVPDNWSASTQFMSVVTTAMQTNPLLRATNFSNIFELGSSGTDNDTSVATPAQGILTRGLNPDPPK
jgi:hypothetical protein